MPRLLFVVHGMGVHGDGAWFPKIKEKLDEVAGRYTAFQTAGSGFSEQVEVVEVNYDSAFTDWLGRWSRSAEAIGESATEHNVAMPDLVGWLRGVDETEKKFFWSHVVDVLLYRYFPLVATPLRLKVARLVLDGIRQARERGSVQVSFLCHSLGTAVLHDSLALLASDPSLNARAALQGDGFPFRSAFMVANVGRVLEQGPAPMQVYSSVVHPLSVRPEDAWLLRYYNVRHALDPFTIVRRFDPPGWGNRYLPVEVDHVAGFDVHDFAHYLDHPSVHVPILNDTVPGSVPQAEAAAAVQAYKPTLGDRCPDQVAALVAEANRIRQELAGREGPADLIRAGTRFLARAREVADACRG